MEDLRKDVADLSAKVGTIAEQLEQLRSESEQQGLDILQRFGVGLALASDLDNGKRVVSASVDPNGFVRVNADRNVRAGVILEFHSFMFCEKLDFDDPDYPAAGSSTSTAVRTSPAASDAAEGEQNTASGSPDTSSDQNTYRQHISEPRYRALERKKGDKERKKNYLKQVPPCNRDRRASGFFVAAQPGSDELIDAIGIGWMWRWPDKLRLVGNRVINFGMGLLSDPNVDVLGEGFVENERAPQNADGTYQQVLLRKTDRTSFFFTMSVEVGR